jgi:2-(3-amino-3-carboxypropyl)histidine synthase
MFDFDLEKITAVIKKHGYKTVALELPEGLRDRATEIADDISSKTKCEVIISSNPCYGACDVNDDSLAALGCEAIFHFGHTQLLSKSSIPVHYVEVRMQGNLLKLLRKGEPLLGRRVGLLTTAQHLHQLGEAKEYLEKKGHEVFISRAKGRLNPGQVLGCSFASAREIASKVDAFAFLGSGDFHPLGIALATGKKTIAFDVETGAVKDMDELKDRTLRQRFAKMARAREATSFGIIIGEKKGQRRIKLALRIKKKLKKLGKKAYLLALHEVTPENLYAFRKLEALVCTACPRIAIDDSRRYTQPILTPQELEMAIGERSWSEYAFDEIA